MRSHWASATTPSVDLLEVLCPECPLEDVDLGLMDLFGLDVTPGQHQLSIEVPRCEHSLKGIKELLDIIKFLVIRKAHAVFLLKAL